MYCTPEQIPSSRQHSSIVKDVSLRARGLQHLQRFGRGGVQGFGQGVSEKGLVIGFRVQGLGFRV